MSYGVARYDGSRWEMNISPWGWRRRRYSTTFRIFPELTIHRKYWKEHGESDNSFIIRTCINLWIPYSRSPPLPYFEEWGSGFLSLPPSPAREDQKVASSSPTSSVASCRLVISRFGFLHQKGEKRIIFYLSHFFCRNPNSVHLHFCRNLLLVLFPEVPREEENWCHQKIMR